MAGDDEATRSFRAAERAFAEKLGLALEERTLAVRGPVPRARILECGEGPPLVFVHGGGSMASAWLPLIAHLRGVRAIAIDRPGCGLTGPYEYARGEDLRAHAVGFLEGVLDALELEEADLVGNSMGSLWTLWLALDRPARVGRLATVGCPALVVGTSAPFAMRLTSVGPFGKVLERPQTDLGFARVMTMLGQDAESVAAAHPGLIPVAVAAGNLPGAGRSFRTLLARVLRLFGAEPDCALDAAALRALRVKPLVVWGSADPFGDLAAARRFADATGGRLEVVGRGHIPWLDAPEAIAEQLLRHFAEVPASELHGEGVGDPLDSA